MIIKLNITKEILDIIPMLYIQTDGDDMVGINRKWLLGGTHLLEDVALVTGKADQFIKGTEEDPEGRAYPEDLEQQMLELYNYVADNLYYIESLVHQFAVKGGLTEGIYKAKDSDLIWEKIN